MCGIVGYVGKRKALPVLVDGLKRLEYRGYDSAGISLVQKSEIKTWRAVGRVSELEKKLDLAEAGNVGIAHTRWATHGAPSEKNAHPQRNSLFTTLHCKGMAGAVENAARGYGGHPPT